MTPDPTTDAVLASRLAAALPTARWFAAKGSAIERVSLHDRVAVPGGDRLALAIADVLVAGQGTPQRYAVAIGPDATDAAASPEFLRWLIDTTLAGQSVTARVGSFVGHGAPAATAAAPSGSVADTTVAAIGGDASNSSFVVRCGATALIVKLLRRCRPGIQPEVEIGEYFAGDSPWPGTPRFRGWLEYAAGREATAIATVHEHAADCTTAWEKLVRLLEAGGLAGPSGAAATAIAARLGRTTAEMHRALASRSDIPAFAPEPATAAGRRAAADRMADHAAAVRATIESRLPRLEPAIAARLRSVLAGWPRLTGRLHAVAEPAPSAGQVHDIRVHGDYHLGQVLVGEHDDRVLVIDFEGEPGRSLEERRRKMPAAKDVAGMCRSFDYLLRHVSKTTGRPYAAADLQRLESGYLDAYRSSAEGHPWWPADRRHADALLAAFTLDKAIYELAYELANRPDWIDVPLAALELAVA